MGIVKDDKFLPSLTIGQIGKVLRGRPEVDASESGPLPAPSPRRTSPPRQRSTTRSTAGSRAPRKSAARSA
ncbi:hypothetical protein ACRAVF_14660 [Bradyrhizobium oligotrophicum S58]